MLKWDVLKISPNVQLKLLPKHHLQALQFRNRLWSNFKQLKIDERLKNFEKQFKKKIDA